MDMINTCSYRYLKQIEGIEEKTIEDFIKYGFESKCDLLAIDLDKDLSKMSDISMIQKLFLRQAIINFRKNIELSENELNSNKVLIKSHTNYEVFDNINNADMNQTEEELDKNSGYNSFEDEINRNEDNINAKEVSNESISDETFIKHEIAEKETEFSFDFYSKRLKIAKQNDNDLNEIKLNHNSSLDLSPKLKNNDNIREFQCLFTNCGKYFMCKNHLRDHLRIHSGEKPFACLWTGCEKRFIKKSDLNRHEMTHTGEKPFVCEVIDCGKRFSEKSHLIRHNRTHTGEKPFKCDECGHCFNENSHLIEHKRKHTGEKPYECDFDYCGKRFSRLSTLTKHKKSKKHTKTQITDR